MTTKSITPKILDQLAKLIPRLASSFDGERLATLAAIQRILATEKLDLHDVVAVLTRANEEEETYETGEEDDETETSPPGWFKLSAYLVLTLVNRIERSSPYLSANAHEFLIQMRQKACDFDPVFVSQKQYEWLRSLADRAR
jgi:hypothetical protein